MEEERLDVGPLEPASRPPEQMRVERLEAGHGGGTASRAEKITGREHVVVQVLADAGEVDERLDVQPPKVGRRADPREHQQLWRLDRARADDDLVPGPRLPHGSALHVLHADTAAALEEEPATPSRRSAP